MTNKGYKFRLYPTQEQESYLAKCFGCSRFVYNHFLRLIRQLDKFFPSSKRCSKCGYIHENLTLDIRGWTCPECGTHHDQDVNAATNILAFCDPQIRQELPKSTPKEPVERQGHQGG